MMFSLGSHLRKLVSRSLFRLHKSLRVIACGSVRQVADVTQVRLVYSGKVKRQAAWSRSRSRSRSRSSGKLHGQAARPRSRSSGKAEVEVKRQAAWSRSSRKLQAASCNLQAATCNLQPATCNLQAACSSSRGMFKRQAARSSSGAVGNSVLAHL